MVRDEDHGGTGLDAVETRRVLVFLLVAFGVSWTVGAYVALTGGLETDPVMLSGTPVSRALLLLAVGYMWGPAVANAVTRLATGEGRADLHLRPRIRLGWPYWLAAWLLLDRDRTRSRLPGLNASGE